MVNVHASSKYSHSRLCLNSPIVLPILFSVSNISSFHPHKGKDAVKEEGSKLGACGIGLQTVHVLLRCLSQVSTNVMNVSLYKEILGSKKVTQAVTFL